MAINTLVLGTKTLAQCTSFTGGGSYFGGATVLANGDLRRDLVDTAIKRRWTLTWTALSKSQLDDVVTAFGEAVAADVSFTAPDATGFTVNAGESPNMTWEAYLTTAGNLRYRATLDLWEA